VTKWRVHFFRGEATGKSGMPSSGMLCRVTPVRIDVSEEHIATVINATRIGELGTTLAVTNNRSTLRDLVVSNC
jgi:hypothetical protein